MLYSIPLFVNTEQVLRLLGYGRRSDADDTTLDLVEKCASAIRDAASARWTYHTFSLLEPAPAEKDFMQLAGPDMERHLYGCKEVILLAVTLGSACDHLLRRTQVTDISGAVLMDACASVLAEQYADAAEELLQAGAADEGRFLTGRFSPGYGSVPLSVQKPFIRLLNAQRAIGLTMSESGILLPRKSITAFLGIADHPVRGALAGCESCAIKDKCDRKKCGRIQ